MKPTGREDEGKRDRSGIKHKDRINEN